MFTRFRGKNIGLNIVSRQNLRRGLSENEQVRNERYASHKHRPCGKAYRRKTQKTGEYDIHNRVSYCNEHNRDRREHKEAQNIVNDCLRAFLEQQIAAVDADCTVDSVFLTVFDTCRLLDEEIDDEKQNDHTKIQIKSARRILFLFFVFLFICCAYIYSRYAQISQVGFERSKLLRTFRRYLKIVLRTG